MLGPYNAVYDATRIADGEPSRQQEKVVCNALKPEHYPRDPLDRLAGDRREVRAAETVSSMQDTKSGPSASCISADTGAAYYQVPKHPLGVLAHARLPWSFRTRRLCGFGQSRLNRAFTALQALLGLSL